MHHFLFLISFSFLFFFFVFLGNTYLFLANSHKGFAFIEFEDSDDALAAIENMHQSELFGKVIRVNLANFKKLPGGSINKPSKDEYFRI